MIEPFFSSRKYLIITGSIPAVRPTLHQQGLEPRLGQRQRAEEPRTAGADDHGSSDALGFEFANHLIGHAYVVAMRMRSDIEVEIIFVDPQAAQS